MDKLKTYRQIIKQVLDEYARIPYAYGEVEPKVVYDHQNDQYLMLAIGWEGVKRVHGCIVHIEIIEDKVWIQQDGTEDGVAGELVEKGIPANDIVLGFRPAQLRQYTGYAVI